MDSKIKTKRNPQNFNAIHWCLGFANTAEWHASDHPEEKLIDYPALVAWARRAGLLNEAEANLLLDEASRRTAEARIALDRVIALREVLYRVFSAIAHKNNPGSEDLTLFNAALCEALSQTRVVATTDGFVLDWATAGGNLEQMLWPVLRSAADLLTSNLLERVGECADDRGCGYLFLDLSRNHSRRWCDMKDCGNRAKAQRHYRRRPTNLLPTSSDT